METITLTGAIAVALIMLATISVKCSVNKVAGRELILAISVVELILLAAPLAVWYLAIPTIQDYVVYFRVITWRFIFLSLTASVICFFMSLTFRAWERNQKPLTSIDSEEVFTIAKYTAGILLVNVMCYWITA